MLFETIGTDFCNFSSIPIIFDDIFGEIPESAPEIRSGTDSGPRPAEIQIKIKISENPGLGGARIIFTRALLGVVSCKFGSIISRRVV